MSYQSPGTQPMQILHRTHPQMVHHLKSLRDHLLNLCRLYVNKEVRVETIDGHVYEGIIVNCDKGHLYLSVSNPNRVFTPYTPSIMPLVLYDLLVISLMSYRDQPDQSQSPVVGNWDTDFGTWAAKASKEEGVYGYYKDDATGLWGMIRGTMFGNKLTGTWDQTEYNGRKGTLEFEFKDNFTRFEGKWNYGDAKPDPNKQWNGKKR
ncbi:hypothetical protein NDK43_06810 [Neobacillus pocheonensis]|uniref:DUF2642 domain-containing protein n=1 Tax=Neobacillus pocheonensis TaxID=363869 RepID=A0ABT0W762_9BACI|nr:hypothetical protein [Neobacillus pocheonensis]